MKKFIVNSSALLAAMTIAKKVISNNPSVPILEDFLFEVNEFGLTISGTDLQTTIAVPVTIERNNDTGPWAFVMPQTFLKYLATLDEQPLVIEWVEKTYQITVTEIEGTALYTGQPAGDFPKVPETPDKFFDADTQLLADMGSLLPILSNDELRPSMTGVCLTTNLGVTRLVGTNGHLLKTIDVLKLSDAAKEQHFIIPSKPVKILASFKFKQPTFLQCCTNDSKQNFSFCFRPNGVNHPITVTFRNIDETYPDFLAVIPTQHTVSFTAQVKELHKVIDKAVLFANKTTKAVVLDFRENKAKIRANDLDFEHSFTAPIEGSIFYLDQRTEFMIAFNADFLSLTLDNFKDEVHLHMVESNRALVIRKGRETALCMPVKLTDAYADVLKGIKEGAEK
jgi:DNA polymerase-3 subunit beta